jgi:hypothetical protein
MSGIRVDETAMGDYSIKDRLKSDRRSRRKELDILASGGNDKTP